MESLEQALRPSPESATLLRRFLTRIVAAGARAGLAGSAEPAFALGRRRVVRFLQE
jgi:hypothetical protein